MYVPAPNASPPYLHGFLVVWAEKLVILVGLDGFTAILPDIEHWENED